MSVYFLYVYGLMMGQHRRPRRVVINCEVILAVKRRGAVLSTVCVVMDIRLLRFIRFFLFCVFPPLNKFLSVVEALSMGPIPAPLSVAVCSAATLLAVGSDTGDVISCR